MAIVGGVLMGVVFDVMRVFRTGLQARGGLTSVFDVVYWIVVTPLTIALLLHTNWGELRLYTFIGIVGGWMLYFSLASPFVLEALLAVWHGTGFVVSWIVHIVMSIVLLPLAAVRNFAYARDVRFRWRGRPTGRIDGPSPGRGSAGRRFGWPWRQGLAWRRR